MALLASQLEGVVILESRRIRDKRGYFMELWRESCCREIGVNERFTQDNISYSHQNVLRGLHLQHPNAQAKLVSVIEGTIFDVAVDVRIGSPTRGKWFGINLSARNGLQMFIPRGFAHGFCVTAGPALVVYKCTSEYDPDKQVTIHWQDPALGIRWPIKSPIVSDKDDSAPCLEEMGLALDW